MMMVRRRPAEHGVEPEDKRDSEGLARGSVRPRRIDTAVAQWIREHLATTQGVACSSHAGGTARHCARRLRDRVSTA